MPWGGERVRSKERGGEEATAAVTAASGEEQEEEERANEGRREGVLHVCVWCVVA